MKKYPPYFFSFYCLSPGTFGPHCVLYVLPTQCIYVFCTDHRTNSDYFPIQH